jgi:indole-3-glycerol phosphate synthase
MILDDIASKTRIRVEKSKLNISEKEMQDAALAIDKGNFPFESALRKPDLSFICEVKKASPSKGVISDNFPYIDIAKQYEEAGASAISVLTEPDFFQGSNAYLTQIAKTVKIPVLRKDFIIDMYQIYEAKVIGAAAILLICALLDEKTLAHYISIADSLGLSALVEAHDENELRTALCAGARIVGVNNRDLRTFEVDINNSLRLRQLVPKNILFVSESGIKTADDIKALYENGTDAVLIGEAFMTSGNKTALLAELMEGKSDEN